MIAMGKTNKSPRKYERSWQDLKSETKKHILRRLEEEDGKQQVREQKNERKRTDSV